MGSFRVTLFAFCAGLAAFAIRTFGALMPLRFSCALVAGRDLFSGKNRQRLRIGGENGGRNRENERNRTENENFWCVTHVIGTP